MLATTYLMLPEELKSVTYPYMKMAKHCQNANMHRDQPYGPLKGICP